MQLTTRQRWFEHIARVHGAIGLSSAHHGMQLIDEQDHSSLFLGELFQHGFQALFELTAKLGSGEQRAHIQRQHAFLFQTFGYFTVNDALSQAFDDGGFTHTRFANQHRVVLGATLQHLNRTADFVIATDHRVELAVQRALGEVQCVLIQRFTLIFGVGVINAGAATQAVDRRL